MGVPLDPRNRRDAEPPTIQVIPAFSPRIIVRTLVIFVSFAISLYLVYLLRKPIGWVLIATFLAVALSGPVNVLNQWMRRGFAITIVYFCLLLIPIGIGALIIPPLVTQGNNLIQNLPRYAQDVQDYTNKNERLRKIEADYNITEKLQQQADKLPARVGDAANVLGNIGLGLVNSLFALFTILVLTAFLLGSGAGWVNRMLELRPPEHSTRIRTALDHMGKAVGAYVGGVLAQATLAAVLAYIVLAILGVPFAGALAIVIFFSDLVPLVGATIGAVLVGVVTVFGDFPTATIIWVIYSIAYQQIENTLIQPQIQKRAVNVHPFIVLVAVLFGSTLLGVIGALVAIPVAASVQIAIREWWDFRHDQTMNDIIAPAGPTAADTPPPAPAV
ncbi:AI-2E family transporter [Solirubrobacter ginsenosidimutans]|uniref:AI-2E family transporter n=1 Tax=Solirubrobacter ginsenosidimutans TaxID=490573 RepID=A0A9X3MUH6_9ACTN|nr:AI-2E family transporter [Solirubrobacter ginsenosidimutans]MDA0162745.1 AI-2E family transporter [Solirubrobacter ginsenosidimutans]